MKVMHYYYRTTTGVFTFYPCEVKTNSITFAMFRDSDHCDGRGEFFLLEWGTHEYVVNILIMIKALEKRVRKRRI